MKVDLKIMQDTYAQYSASTGVGKQMGNLVDVFQTCENVLSGERKLNNVGGGGDVKKSVNIAGKDFQFFDPNQLSQSQFGVSPSDLEIAKAVLAKFKTAAQSQTQLLEQKI